MEPDVTSTLTELERKLKELERELEAVGRGGEADTDAAQAGWTSPEPEPKPEPEPPAPPPPGTTPFTAVWHGQAEPPPQQAPQVVEWRAYSSPAPPQQELDDLVRFRERLVHAANSLVTELSRVLAELNAAPPPQAPPAEPLLEGRIVVEAAPFGSVATLGAFEQALAQTPGVVHAQVRSLEGGRATLDVDLDRPTALTGELARTTPVGFRVVHAGDGRLVLEVDAGG